MSQDTHTSYINNSTLPLIQYQKLSVNKQEREREENFSKELIGIFYDEKVGLHKFRKLLFSSVKILEKKGTRGNKIPSIFFHFIVAISLQFWFSCTLLLANISPQFLWMDAIPCAQLLCKVEEKLTINTNTVITN